MDTGSVTCLDGGTRPSQLSLHVRYPVLVVWLPVGLAFVLVAPWKTKDRQWLQVRTLGRVLLAGDGRESHASAVVAAQFRICRK